MMPAWSARAKAEPLELRLMLMTITESPTVFKKMGRIPEIAVEMTRRGLYGEI
jgi:hypothetical protein